MLPVVLVLVVVLPVALLVPLRRSPSQSRLRQMPCRRRLLAVVLGVVLAVVPGVMLALVLLALVLALVRDILETPFWDAAAWARAQRARPCGDRSLRAGAVSEGGGGHKDILLQLWFHQYTCVSISISISFSLSLYIYIYIHILIY